MTQDFDMPPKTRAQAGHERRVGFEFEFSGVGLEKSARIVAQLAGGKLEREHRFVYRVTGGRFGTFNIESDSSILSKKKWEKYLRMFGYDPTRETWG
ncbi:MAG: amidoligase family protein, partial [Bdellovibrionota bacterium]